MKGRKLAAAAMFGIVMVLSGCAPQEGAAFELDHAVSSLRGTEATLNLQEIVSGDWDRVAVFCWEIDASQISTTLGFTWDYGAAGIDPNSIDQLLVFAVEDQVFATVTGAGVFEPNFCSYKSYATNPGPYLLEAENSDLKFVRSSDADAESSSRSGWSVVPESILAKSVK